MLEQITQQQTQWETAHRERKATPRHRTLKERPEPERCAQLRTTRKHFVDTIKLIAYRAETALVCKGRGKNWRAPPTRGRGGGRGDAARRI